MNEFTVMSSMMRNAYRVKDTTVPKWEILYGKDDVTVFAIVKAFNGGYINTVVGESVIFDTWMQALAAGMNQYILVARRVYAKNQIDTLGKTLKDLRSAANTATEGKVFAQVNTRWVLAFNEVKRMYQLANPMALEANTKPVYFNERPKDKDPKDGNGVRLEFLTEKENYAKMIAAVEEGIDKLQDAINAINTELYA